MKRWTDEDLHIAIRDYHGGMSAKQIAIKLGRTPKAVNNIFSKMNVRLTREDLLDRARKSALTSWNKKQKRFRGRLTAIYKDEQL